MFSFFPTFLNLFAYLVLASAQGNTLIARDIPGHFVTRTGAAVPEATEVHPEVPDGGGLDVVFGSDIKAAFSDAYAANCADGPATEGCWSSVTDAIGFGTAQEETGLSKRIASLVEGAWAVGFAIAAYLLYHESDAKLVDSADDSHTWMLQDELDAINALDPADSYVFKTATDDPSPLTISVTPVATPDPTWVPSASQDSTEWVFSLPTGVPEVITDATANAVCPRSVRNRRQVMEEPPDDLLAGCIRMASEDIAKQMQTGGRLENVQFLGDWPVVPNGLDQVVEDVVDFNDDMDFFGPGGAEGVANPDVRVAAGRWAVTMSWVVLSQHITMTNLIRIPSDRLKEPDYEEEDPDVPERFWAYPNSNYVAPDDVYQAAVQMRLDDMRKDPYWLRRATRTWKVDDPECPGSDLTAPRHDSDGSPSLDEAMGSFCVDNSGNALGGDTPTNFAKFVVNDEYSYWLEAAIWTDSPNRLCNGEVAYLNSWECKDALMHAMDTCDPGSGAVHNAVGYGECVKYSLYLDDATDGQEPPTDGGDDGGDDDGDDGGDDGGDDPPPIIDGSNYGSCGNGETIGTIGINSNPIDKDTINECLRNLDTSKWLDAATGSALVCSDMVRFESASTAWDSPSDCYNACKHCLSQSIYDGKNQQWCDARKALAHCWIGYQIPNPPALDIGGGDHYMNGNDLSSDYGDTGRDGKYIDRYALQKFLEGMDQNSWHTGDSTLDFQGVLTIFMKGGWGWKSPKDCYTSVINCVSQGVADGANGHTCESYAGFAVCTMGFYA